MRRREVLVASVASLALAAAPIEVAMAAEDDSWSMHFDDDRATAGVERNTRIEFGGLDMPVVDTAEAAADGGGQGASEAPPNRPYNTHTYEPFNSDHMAALELDGVYYVDGVDPCSAAGTADGQSMFRTTVTVGTDGSLSDPRNAQGVCLPPGAPTASGAPASGAAVPAPIVVTLTQEDFQSLPIAAPPLTLNPNDWLPVQLEMIASAEDQTQVLTTTVLGQSVEVHAIPMSWTWDFGDGTVMTTESPGEPWPAFDITHVYGYEGIYDVTVTTTFNGIYAVNGGPFQTIPGTAQVTSEPQQIEAVEFTARLGTPPDDE